MVKVIALWIPFMCIPLVAWSRDIAVVVLILGAGGALFQGKIRWWETLRVESRTPFFKVTVGFLLWSFAAVFWAPHLPLISWIKVFLALFAVIILATGLSKLSLKTIERLKMPVLGAIAALFCLLVFERSTDGFLIRFDRTTDTSVQILDTLSGGLVLLGCVCFPIAWLLWRQSETRVWPATFVLACLTLSLTYRMDAIPLGLVVGTLAFFIVLYWPTRAFVAVTAIVAVIALIWGPLAIAASALQVDSWLIENIDRNWGYRIIIWQHVGELLRSNFFVGFGFDASRVIGAAADLLPERDGTSTFLHPHNGMLQLWLELGFIGAMLFIGMMGLLFRRALMASPSPGAMAAAAGTFGFSVTIWLLSYGVWQGWWLAVLGLSICSVVLIFRLDRRSESN